MDGGLTYTFRNPQGLASTVVLWLYADLAFGVLAGLGAAISIADTASMGAGAPKDTELPSDLLVGLIALGQFVIAIVTGFLILKWIYRVSRNAHSMAKGFTNTPTWAVVWYFVPIALLWKPFQALRETWQASARPADWASVPIPAALRWWWGLFLLSNVLSQISLRLWLRSETLADVAASAGWDVAGAMVAVPLDLVFIWIVRELTRMQAGEISAPKPATAPA